MRSRLGPLHADECCPVTELSSDLNKEVEDVDMESDTESESDGSSIVVVDPPEQIPCRYMMSGWGDHAFAQHTRPESWELPQKPFKAYPWPHFGHDAFKGLCENIARKWHTRVPARWLPASMIEHTRYSFTLLTLLHHAANLTTNLKNNAHRAILDARAERVGDRDLLNETQKTSVNEFVHTVFVDPRIEKTITENLSGITLDDMKRAIKRLKKERRERKLNPAVAYSTRQTAATDRATERRRAKVARDVSLQQALWKDQAGADLELVNVELQDATDTNPPHSSLWRKLKKQARATNKKHKFDLAVRSREQQKLGAYAAAKSSRYTKTSAARSKDMSQLVDQLDDDDKSWTDGDGEKSDTDAVLDACLDLEPTTQHLWINQSKRAQKGVKQLTKAIEPRSALSVEPVTTAVTRRRHKKEQRKANSRAQKHAQWVNEVQARSQPLPSEMMDFSAIGKLQSSADAEEMKNMAENLETMLHHSKHAD